jgi:hypothetical protein
MRKGDIAFAMLVLVAASSASAQSTTNWIPLNPIDTSLSNGNLGASYVSIGVMKTPIYQDSNWWTKLVERNRSALVTVTLSGNVNGVQIADRRVSPAIAIQKNKALLDVGWAPVLVQNLPVNFSSLQVQTEVGKTAQDGVESLIAAANFRKRCQRLSFQMRFSATYRPRN